MEKRLGVGSDFWPWLVATPLQDLWRNTNDNAKPSVGYHPHHCDADLAVVSGEITNMLFDPNKQTSGLIMRVWDYVSPLRGQVGRFEAHSAGVSGYPRAYAAPRGEMLEAGDAVHMASSQFHTIYVRKGAPAAWLVYEGAEDPNYKPICYSGDDLAKFDFSGMYEPMSEREVERAIQSVLQA